MFYSIDRFEENFAVLISYKDGSGLCVDRGSIPEDAKEGAVLKFENGEYIFDPDETARRRKALFMRTKMLIKKRKA